MMRTKSIYYIVTLMTLFFVLQCYALTSYATMTPAGTILKNTAYVTYFNDDLNINERVDSNTVMVKVKAVSGVSLTPDQTLNGSAGIQMIFPHLITNASNVPLVVTLNQTYTTDSQFHLTDAKIYIDTNNNGIPDVGETAYTFGQSLPELAVGSSYNILVVGKTPLTVSDTQASTFALQVSGSAPSAPSLPPVYSQVVDKINISNSEALRVTKSSPAKTITTYSRVNYILRIQSLTGSVAEPIDVIIDNNATQKVILRDSIPAMTTFNSIVFANDAQVLYHLKTDVNPHSYTTTEPDDLSTIDAIAFGWDKIADGSTKEVQFRVETGDILPSSLINRAETYQTINGKVVTTYSNKVVQPSNGPQNLLSFYFDDQYTYARSSSSRDETFYLGAYAPVCNIDKTVKERWPVTLSDYNSDDILNGLYLEETAPDSGLFTLVVPVSQWPENDMSLQDGLLSVAQTDEVNATMQCGSTLLSTTLDVSDASLRNKKITFNGYVFDSRDQSKVIPNAEIKIYSTDVTYPQHSYDLEGTTTTNSKGWYSITFLRPPYYNDDPYRFLINVTASGYSHPSSFAASVFNKYKVNVLGSYAKDYIFPPKTSITRIDMPVDMVGANDLQINKTVNKTTASFGDVVQYKVEYVNNNLIINHNNAVLYDVLPQGIAYIPHSAKQVTSTGITTDLADPVGGVGPNLAFKLNMIHAKEKGYVTYATQVRNSAKQGKKVNSAQLITREGRSNSSYAQFDVQATDMSDEATLIGSIYADCNHNRLKDADELSIPFVKFYLEDGTYIISDENGLFSLYGLSPKTHVIKLDKTTLPKGSQLEKLNNRMGGKPDSQFIDLKKGELHRADFAIENCTPDILNDIKQRQGSWSNSEIQQQLNGLSKDPSALLNGINQGDLKARPASGVLKRTGEFDNNLTVANFTDKKIAANPSEGSPRTHAMLIMQPIKDLLPLLDKTVDFIGLVPDQLMPTPLATIRVKGPIHSQLLLSVNDAQVDVNRVGEKSRYEHGGTEAWEYVGVPLVVGYNKLTVTAKDQDGKVLGTKSIDVRLAGPVKSINLTAVGDGTADGMTPLPIVVQLLDSHGWPINGPMGINLDSSGGKWDVSDNNPFQPGVQNIVDNGEAVFNLYSSTPSTISIKVSSNNMEKSLKVNFRAEDRPLIAVGIIDGAIGLHGLKNGDVEGVTNKDGFEQELRSFMSERGDSGSMGARVALFLKGKVKGDYLLTLSYDSDKNTHDQLFRDLDPNKYYPVYGDNSVRGFDAQSSGPLYIRVDKGKSYVLYGDYNTDAQNSFLSDFIPFKSLARYDRSVTGLKGEYNTSRVHITYFAADTDYLQKIITFRANGTSGPFDLNMGNYVENSEEVTLVTRNRSQPNTIMKEQKLNRLTDYSLDIFGRSLLFTRPIPSTDDENNPIEIRITYNVADNGEKYWLYGADGEVNVTKGLTLGASFVEDKAPNADLQRLVGVRGVNYFNDNHAVVAEVAETTSPNNDTGKAYRIEWRMKKGSLDSSAKWQKASEFFNNDTAGINKGVEDAKVDLTWTTPQKTQIKSEAIYTRSLIESSKRTGVTVTGEHPITPEFSITAGTRYAKEETNNYSSLTTQEQDKVTSLLAKLTWRPKSWQALQMFLEGEKSIDNNNREMLATGAEYGITSKLSLYGRHEIVSRRGARGNSILPGSYGLVGSDDGNVTKLGVKYNYASNSNAYSEYRVSDNTDGQSTEGAMGLNHIWNISNNLMLSGSFEKVHVFDGTTDQGNSLAATLGIGYNPTKALKTYNRLEWRESQNQQTWLVALSAANSLTQNWTGLASGIYAYDKTKDSGAIRNRYDVRVGLAYRDKIVNRLHALGRYQYRSDDNDGNLGKTNTHVLVGLANYLYNPDLILSGRYGIKYQCSNEAGLNHHAITQLSMGRATYDLTPHWDIGCMGSIMFGDGAHQSAYGCEMGYLFGNDIWLSVGYNFQGFYDSDLAGSEYTRDGAYLRLRIKFDENAFNWLTE